MPRCFPLTLSLLAVLAAGCVIVPAGPLTGPQAQPDVNGPAGGAALAPHLPPANVQAPAGGAAAVREGAAAPKASAQPSPAGSPSPAASASPKAP